MATRRETWFRIAATGAAHSVMSPATAESRSTASSTSSPALAMKERYAGEPSVPSLATSPPATPRGAATQASSSQPRLSCTQNSKRDHPQRRWVPMERRPMRSEITKRANSSARLATARPRARMGANPRSTLPPCSGLDIDSTETPDASATTALSSRNSPGLSPSTR